MTGYFALAYGISWGGILILLVARGLDLAALQRLDTSLMVVLMLPGQSTSGLALTALLDGRTGLRRLLASLMRWWLGGRWYAVALLTTPLFRFAIPRRLSAFVDPAFAPRFQWPLLAIGLVAASFVVGAALPLAVTALAPSGT